MKPSSDQTVTRDADKGSSKASPAKNGTSSYGSGVPGWDIIFKTCPKPLLQMSHFRVIHSALNRLLSCSLLYREIIQHVKWNDRKE